MEGPANRGSDNERVIIPDLVTPLLGLGSVGCEVRFAPRLVHVHACANDHGALGTDHLDWPATAELLPPSAIAGRWRSRA